MTSKEALEIAMISGYPEYVAGCYIWSPPPAAASIVLEELRKARQKRQGLAHLFICPRLMYPYWQCHLF